MFVPQNLNIGVELRGGVSQFASNLPVFASNLIRLRKLKQS